MAQVPKKTVKAVTQKAANVVYDIPYLMANIENYLKSSIQPHVPWVDDAWKTDEEWAAFKPTPRQELEWNMEDLTHVRTDEPSARLAPYYEGPTSDISPEALQQILAARGFRPTAANYLSKIPVKVGQRYMNSGDPRTLGEWHPMERFISLPDKDQLNNPDLDVMRHEYLHAAPRLGPLSAKNSKVADFVLKNDKGMQNTVPVFTQRWGKQYMSRPGAMAEEMFAEGLYPTLFYNHILSNPAQTLE